MRICVDATSLLLRSAGVKNYVYHWMRSLAEYAPEHEISGFPMLGEVGDLDHDRSNLGALSTLPRIAYLQFVNKVFPAAISLAVRNRVDIFHASNLVHAIPKRVRLTSTVYDMTTVLMPQFHIPANVDAEEAHHRRVFQNADGLIAISESARDDAVRILRLNPDRVQVVYPGIAERFFNATPRTLPGLTKPYVLCVGTVEPRKNIDTLLDAWLALPKSTREAHELVFAGPIGWAGNATVERLRSGIEGVRVLGYVPEADMPSLTAGATAFAYVSLYEGFGFPLAQAMAAGVPSITSNVSSMPEVAGDAGILVDPHSAAEIASAIDRVLTSEILRDDLRVRGKERAKRFTWKNSAEQSAEFFTRVGS